MNELAARTVQSVTQAAADLRRVVEQTDDLPTLQAVLKDTRIAFATLDAEVQALGWKVVLLENEEAQRAVAACSLTKGT